MKIVLIGSSGMLGSRMLSLLRQKGHEVSAPSLEELDLTDEVNVRSCLGSRDFEVLVNCAAYTDVDACEDAGKYQLALQVNATSVGWLARECGVRGATLVHFSTDYVFDGRKTGPYDEGDPAAPVNAYGRTKRLGEEAILRTGVRHYQIRTSWLYGPGGRHFVGTIARLLREKDRVEVVNDQRGAPTNTADLSLFTEEILVQRAEPGFYHFSNEGETTWYGVALEVQRWMGIPEGRIVPTTSDRFKRPAARPANSRFDLAKSRVAVGHPFRSWEEALKEYLEKECP